MARKRKNSPTSTKIQLKHVRWLDIIKPYMENTANNIFNQLGISEDLQEWDTLRDNKKLNNIIVTDKPEVLFARLDIEEEIEYIKAQMKV